MENLKDPCYNRAMLESGEQKKLHLRKTFIPLVLIPLAVIFYIRIKCRIQTSVQIEYRQSPTIVTTDIHSVKLFMSIPDGKIWPEANKSVGAEYDFIVRNDTCHDFTDWEIVISAPENYYIDSTWAGTYLFEYSGREALSQEKEYAATTQNKSTTDLIHVKAPAGYSRIIPAGGSVSFGLVMYSPYRFNAKNVKIIGHHIHKAGEYRIYRISELFLFLVIIIFIIHVSVIINVRFKVREYELLRKKSNEIILQSFKTFANFVDAKDPYTKGHSTRVAYYAKEMGRRLGFSEQRQQEIFWEGQMHDVGKISIKDEILNKPEKLTDEEFNNIRNHSVKGYEMLKDFTSMPMLKEVALSHHEKWDGSGYMNQLRGTEIPLDARIIGICDSYDAMNTDRVYRKKLSKERIMEEIRKCSGTQFDPQLAEIMLQIIKDGFMAEAAVQGTDSRYSRD